MTDKIVPDTDSIPVASLAVAWEIVRLSYVPNVSGTKEEILKEITNAVIKVNQALQTAKFMEK